jgi:hypothetical protein
MEPAPFLGSGVGRGLGRVVDMASDGGPTLQALAGLPAIRRGHLAGSPTGWPGRSLRRYAGPRSLVP